MPSRTFGSANFPFESSRIVDPLRALAAFALLLVATACGSGKRSDAVGIGDDAGAGDDGGGLLADVGVAFEGGVTSPACLAASEARSSVGCEYYAVQMDSDYAARNGCFAAFVANTSDAPAHIGVSFGGEAIDMRAHAALPTGSGPTLKYEPYPGVLAPGKVAILFLAGLPDAVAWDPKNAGSYTGKPVACPIAPARSSLTQLIGSGIGRAFHIQTDTPVVAYQMLPYGGGQAAVTGASLLVPTSAWDTNYVAVTSYPGMGTSSLVMVALEDATTVTINPKVAIESGTTTVFDPSPAGVPRTFKVDAGQYVQISQVGELTGSVVGSDKPIGMFGGAICGGLPDGVPNCDHVETTIPGIRVLGHSYAVASYRPRDEFEADATRERTPLYRIVGVVDGTTLTFDPPIAGAPRTIGLGATAEFAAHNAPFTVLSQDAAHPFVLMSYMSGNGWITKSTSDDPQGLGDPEEVRVIPTDQWLSRYVFFTDPTYPETNLVVVRKAFDGLFSDVKLDCAGALTGWANVDAAGLYQFTRIDLSTGAFRGQNGCDNGGHVMSSDRPFALTVWGWGSAATSSMSPPIYTQCVSYGYPAGENLAALNTVTVDPKTLK